MAITNQQRDDLARQATEARTNAYAPYSGYAVGAALLTETGRVFRGGNVENAAYPASMCAERSAVFSAVAAGERKFSAIAVATDNAGSPCGSCRQVLGEFNLEMTVYLVDAAGEIQLETSVDQLLPHAFGPGSLR
ncbi:MAG: cytidine deaminase [Anaerolineales bacterium]|jgi:cytidine deaminase